MSMDTHAGTHVLREGQSVSLHGLDDDRAVSFVVVGSDGRAVTVRTPSRLRTPFAVGEEVRVRYSVIDDASYAGTVFLSTVDDQEGCPEYTFTLPADMTRLQARNFRRLALLADDVPVQVTEDGSSDTREGRIIDISAGGAGVLLRADLAVGAPVRVQCSLEGGSLALDVQAEVVRRSPMGDQYGLRFTGLRPAVEDKIVAFVLRSGLQRS